MILLVPWTLLLFGISLSSGHYIREAEEGNTIYKVQENPSGITFENPKQDKRTLREILYYHIIERPRETPEEPAVTERSFTNSHGNQFLDLAQLLEDYDEKDQEDPDGSYPESEQQELEDQDDGNHEEEPELTITQKPLTDEDVKEAYKGRSYLFDQMRQRYSVKRMALPDSLNRRKRQADMQPIPDAPFSSGSASKEAYMQPKTYGMNLNSDGGYVWNNLNKPPTYYELGPSSGNTDEGYGSSQSQENIPPSSENSYISPVSEPSDSGSSEDIFVATNKPSAQTGVENPEPINENVEPNENPDWNRNQPMNDYQEPNGGANYPVQPILGDDSKDESESGFTNPIGPEVFENPASALEDPEPSAPLGVPVNEGPVGEPNGNGYGSPQEEPKPEVSSEEGSEGEKIKEMPEAPTLPSLNYDNLPDYIRDAISSTERPTSYEQTDNPYSNPQPSPEEHQIMQDNMEGIFATAQPVDDIPKTYGMNLTSGGGHVWNDMVNPPVSYDVGSPSQEEEQKEEKPQTEVTEQPAIQEPVNPLPEPTETENEPNNTEESSQEPEIHESEEDKPIEEPSAELEEPITDPEPEDNKPIEEPVETVEPEPVETAEPETENPELVTEGNEETEQTSEEPAESEEDKKPDIMSELLKSEQFWKWLGEWTATYMELLEKHIRKIAIQEICNREKSGEQMCLLNDQPQETGVVVKDGKIIVDGKEIDITHTDNLDKDLKRGHQNKGDNDKKIKNENKVEASTIYGNSVGNEKVTNVFIFTADKADEVIDKLKPTNDSDVDFIIDDRIKENEDEKNKEKSAEDETEPKESIEGEEESSVSEVSKEDVNAETIEDANKEETIEGEPSKEDPNEESIREELPESEASKEELNNEEDKKEDVIMESNKNDSNKDVQIDSSKSSENKRESTSGDIKEDEVEESKLKPSESES